MSTLFELHEFYLDIVQGFDEAPLATNKFSKQHVAKQL
jgi:hypothetical protein